MTVPWRQVNLGVHGIEEKRREQRLGLDFGIEKTQ